MKIEFVNILHVEESVQLEVRNWRNQENVKKFMYTDNEISKEQHLNWLKSLDGSSENVVYLIKVDDVYSGIVSVNQINNTHKTAESGFYLKDDSLRGTGVAVLIEYKLLEMVFNSYQIEKFNCAVLETNEAVIKLHEKFGFSIEGIRRKNIVKNGERINVVLMGMTADEWKESKLKLPKAIAKLI